jgi:hypothetical protein
VGVPSEVGAQLVGGALRFESTRWGVVRLSIRSLAHLAGGEFEPGLMELLLTDMKGQAGAVPFLEHALFKFWQKRDGRRLMV